MNGDFVVVVGIDNYFEDGGSFGVGVIYCF